MAYLLSTTTKTIHLPIIDCRAEEVPYRFEIMDILKRMKMDPRKLRYKDEMGKIGKESWFSLYDHNARANIDKVNFIIDHHDHKEVKAKKHLIAKMGSALTHLYFILNPVKMSLVHPETEEDKKYKQLFNDFVSE